MLSHVDRRGKVRMVDVSHKENTLRTAVAAGTVRMAPDTLASLAAANNPKGDVLTTARIAAVQAAKRCHELIPLCHSLSLSDIDVHMEEDPGAARIAIEVRCSAHGATGVEMEALTAVSVAALTIYDMCKADDKGMVIGEIRLLRKHGGSSGTWERPAGS